MGIAVQVYNLKQALRVLGNGNLIAGSHQYDPLSITPRRQGVMLQSASSSDTDCSGGVFVLDAPYHFNNSFLVCGETLTRLKTLLACEMSVIFSACMRW